MKISQYVRSLIVDAIKNGQVQGASIGSLTPVNIKVTLGDVEEIQTASLMGHLSTAHAMQFSATMPVMGERAEIRGHVVMPGMDVIGEWTI